MKRIYFLVVLLFLYSFSAHKFYVSITQIDYKTEQKTFTITTRLFTDDLEKTINQRHHKKIYLATERQLPEAENLIKNYFLENFKLTQKKKTILLNLKKISFEDESTILVFETQKLKNATNIELKNSLLLDTFAEQQNIVHLNINGTKKSFVTKTDDCIFKF